MEKVYCVHGKGQDSFKKLCSGNGFIHRHKTVIHYSSMASLTSLQQLDLSVRLCLQE